MSDVAYECVSYLQQLPMWALMDDVYLGDRAWLDYKRDGSVAATAKTRRYLPQEAGENDGDYHSRVSRSHFSDKLSQAIKDFVGVIFNNGVQLVDLPEPMREHWQNLDGNGLQGDRLCALIGLQVLRRGHSFVLVDFPALDESVVSLADASKSNRHPIWCPIAPQQVLNWRFTQRGNRKYLSMAVIKTQSNEPDAVGFGETQKTYFMVMTPGRYDVFEPVKKAGSREIDYVRVPEKSGQMGRRVRGRFEPLTEVPLVCLYGGDRTGFLESNPTLFSLAKLNVSHYQVKSDHRQKMHYCCFPTPIRTGGDGSDLTLGPRTVVDVPVGGGFGWSEPNASSLIQSRQDLADIEQEMDLLGSDYLVKPSDRQAAMTSTIQAAKVESELYLFASDLAQGITQCLSHHADYLGLASGGRAELDTKFFRDLAADPQLLQVLSQLRVNEDLTREELRAVLLKKKILEEEQ